VYLENTQTSWNFSENRDRCVYENAPLPVERGIKCEQDLERPAVKQLRPTHVQPYPRIASHCKAMNKKETEIMDLDWEQLSEFTRSFFSHSSFKSASSQTADHTTTLGLKWKEAGSKKPSTGTEINSKLLAAALQKKVEFKKEEWEDLKVADLKVADLSTDSYIKAGNSYFKPAATSDWSNFFKAGANEYRKRVEEIMEQREPCVLLLCSPPGAGKSHFSSELAENIKSKFGLRRAFIDGSDDRLVWPPPDLSPISTPLALSPLASAIFFSSSCYHSMSDTRAHTHMHTGGHGIDRNSERRAS
jgi:hypothetical protein